MIIWGSKSKIKKLGYVAEFCPICRDIQQFQISRLNIVKHIYFLSLGSGQVVGFPSCCQTCETDQELDATSYPTISKTKHFDIESSVAETNPEIRTHYAERLEIEKRITSKQTISDDERLYLINEPFEIYAETIEQKYGESTAFDKPTGVGCLTTIFFPFSVLLIAGLLNQEALIEDVLGPAALVVFAIGTIITMYFLFTVHSRYIKDTVVPIVAKCLKALEPTKIEIDEVLSRYKTAGMKLGKKLRSHQIIEELNRDTQQYNE